MSRNNSYSTNKSGAADEDCESKLDYVRQQWMLLAESSGIGLWYYDYEKKVLVWDENARFIFGGKEKIATVDVEFIKKRIHPDDRKHLMLEIDKMKKANYGLTVNFRIIRPDGSIRNVKLHGMAERNQKGEIIKIIGISYDVTEYIQAKNEYMELKTQLLKASKMESLGNLAAGIAHDFNNMLAVIVGSIDLASLNSNMDIGTVRYLNNIRTAAEKSAALTRQLLAYSRQQNVEPKVLDINDSIENLLSLLKRMLTKEIDLIWFPGEKVPTVKMDPSQVDQILTNLCINSRDAIEGSGKIIIETSEALLDERYCEAHAGASPGKYLLISISDNGSGIDKKFIKRIFEPFFTTKEMGKGTGLGLATVYGIVKQNKGYITVYSELNKGTSVKVYLPVYSDEKVHQKAEKAVEKLLLGKETILLVEDEPLILTIATNMLEHIGYKVLTASKPSEAVFLAKKHPGKIQLILCDTVLPEMGGVELVKNVSENQPSLKCLFMSGYSAKAVRDFDILDKNVPFIEKPFTLKNLAQKVRSVIDN